MLILKGSAPNIVIVNDPANLSANPVSVSLATGSSLTTVSGIATFVAGLGQCFVQLNATDTAATGDYVYVSVDGGGAILGRKECQIVAFDPSDATALGLSLLDAAVSSRGTSTYAGGAVASVTGDVGGNVVGTVKLDATQAAYAPAKAGDAMDIITTPNATGMAAFATALLDLAAGVTTGRTVREWFKLAAAALFGKHDITGTTHHFRDEADTKDVITATVDTAGQRTAVTPNP